jgi:hypothetical protein
MALVMQSLHGQLSLYLSWEATSLVAILRDDAQFLFSALGSLSYSARIGSNSLK